MSGTAQPVYDPSAAHQAASFENAPVEHGYSAYDHEFAAAHGIDLNTVAEHQRIETAQAVVETIHQTAEFPDFHAEATTKAAALRNVRQMFSVPEAPEVTAPVRAAKRSGFFRRIVMGE